MPTKLKPGPDWRKKFLKSHYETVQIMERDWGGGKIGQRMYISSCKTIADYVATIPPRAIKTIPDLRTELAHAHHADFMCPLTASIFLRIAAEVALLDLAEGKTTDEVTPFWRVIDAKSTIAKKLTCGLDGLKHFQFLEQGAG